MTFFATFRFADVFVGLPLLGLYLTELPLPGTCPSTTGTRPRLAGGRRCLPSRGRETFGSPTTTQDLDPDGVGIALRTST